MLQLKITHSTEDAKICVFEINHNMESAVLTINENYILISYLYGSWMMKLFLPVQCGKY